MKKTNVIGLGLAAILWLSVTSCGPAPKQENFDNNGAGMDRDHTRTKLDTNKTSADSTEKAGVHEESGGSRNSL